MRENADSPNTDTFYAVFIIRIFFSGNVILTIPALCISESSIEIKIKTNFYFHTFLWCLKRFYEGHIFSLRPGIGREGLS